MTRKTSAQIETWIVSYLANELAVPAAQIPLDDTLTDLGLSSRQAVFLTGELEDFTGQPVDPAIAWEHPTIRKLAAHLASDETAEGMPAEGTPAEGTPAEGTPAEGTPG